MLGLLASLLLAGGFTSPAGIVILDEAVDLGRVQRLALAGAGVACVNVAGLVTCTIAGGGPGSANVAEVTVDFGVGGDTLVTTTVTGQAWVGGTSKIICSPTLLAVGTRAEGAEDAIIEGLTAAVHTRSVGVGFKLTVAPTTGKAYGQFIFHCTGA